VKAAFVDSSVVVAIAAREDGWSALRVRVRQFEHVLASPLLEAEVAAALRRVGGEFDATIVDSLTWIHAPRRLTAEVRRVLNQGLLRGADCWHLATALHVAPIPAALTFLTADVRQQRVAQGLGFAV
jgi:predicted nucleic acid-binding protein